MTPPLTPLDTFRKNFVIFYQKVVFLGKKHILACLGAPPLFREIPIKKRFFKSLPQSGGGQVVPSCFHLCPVSATRCVEWEPVLQLQLLLRTGVIWQSVVGCGGVCWGGWISRKSVWDGMAIRLLAELINNCWATKVRKRQTEDEIGWSLPV